MERDEAIALRADLLQLATGLELQRAAVLSIVARLEKTYHIEKGKNHDKSKTTSVHSEAKVGEHSEN